jgi:hypothetical protein
MAAPKPRAAGRVLAAPASAGRRTADLPPLALPACLSTLETKLWPWPLPRFFGALGRTGNRRRGGRSWLRSLQALACPVVRSTRTCLHWRGPRAPRGTAAKPLRAAPPPRADWLSTRQVPRPLSCLPPLPLAVAPGIGGPAALLHEQPARRRTRQWPQARRVRGKTPARWTAAPKAARSAVRMHPHCTRDDTATNSRTTCPMAR